MNEGLDLIPEVCRKDMSRYIVDGVRPGGFLFAVLTNDLCRTYLYLDDINRDRIGDYITFLTQYAPPNCFGSRAKVEEWIEDASERRALANLKGPQP
jgi:hypothetical protein